MLAATGAELIELRSQVNFRRWLPGPPRVFETLAASPCRGWSRRARWCSFRPAPGPEVRRRHSPAPTSAGSSRRWDPLGCAASGQVSGSRPRGASPEPHLSLVLRNRGWTIGWWSGGGSVRGPTRFLCWRTLAKRGPGTVCTGPATSDD